MSIASMPISVWFAAAFLVSVIAYVVYATRRPMTSGVPERIEVWGSHTDCKIPYPLAVRIVEEIDPAGIHRSGFRLNVDGGKLADLADKGMPGLSFLERRALRRLGDIGTESAALSFSGEVQFFACPLELVERAQERGSATGFAYTDATMAIAAQAAARRRDQPQTKPERRCTPLLII